MGRLLKRHDKSTFYQTFCQNLQRKKVILGMNKANRGYALKLMLDRGFRSCMAPDAAVGETRSPCPPPLRTARDSCPSMTSVLENSSHLMHLMMASLVQMDQFSSLSSLRHFLILPVEYVMLLPLNSSWRMNIARNSDSGLLCVLCCPPSQVLPYRV